MTRTEEKEPGFRKAMYLLMLALLIGYLGLKGWHIAVAFDAFANQPLSEDTTGAAK